MAGPGAWNVVAPLATARSHCAVAAWEGQLYAIAGGGPNFESLKTVEVYNPRADEWGSGRPLPSARSGAIAVTVGWEIYVMGGGYRSTDGRFTFLTRVDVYTPAKDIWQEGPDLLKPHDYPGATVLPGRPPVEEPRIVVVGGHDPDATGGPKTDPGFAFCESLSPTHPQWVALPPLPTPRFALAGVVYGGRLLAMGGCGYRPNGFQNFPIVEAYDPRRRAWRAEPDLTLPWPGAGLAACVHNGRLYVFGGYAGEAITDRAAVYDPAARTWQDLPPMPSPRAAMAAVPVEAAIYIVGGWARDGRTPIHDVLAYEPGA